MEVQELDHTYDLDPASPIPYEDAPPQTQQGVEAQSNLPVEEEKTSKTRISRPVFDSARLVSDVGLPKLKKTLLKATFKDKGTSRRDLKKLVSIYELWGHRLMPRSNQDDIAKFLLKGGEDSQVKAFRKDLIDQDKYGSVEVDKPDLGSDSEFDDVDKPVETTETADVDSGVSGAAASSAPGDDIPSDSELAELLQQPPPAPPQPAPQDDEWEVYKQLGF